MKKSLITAVGALLVMAGCKPSQSAYEEVYQAAVAKRQVVTESDDYDALQGTIYSRIRERTVERYIPLGADTLHITTELVTVTEGIAKDSLQRYNVVASRFKQVFNARQMAERLKGEGYDEVFIVQTEEPLYYTCVLTTDMAALALNGLRGLAGDSTVTFQQGMPFVLESARNRR